MRGCSEKKVIPFETHRRGYNWNVRKGRKARRDWFWKFSHKLNNRGYN